ncbi:MAG: nucleotide-binding protein [Candidatus Thorarchaeota archaeon]|nr:nucleotide-binding protein [Candidatus Thorarchaeota archaeon]
MSKVAFQVILDTNFLAVPAQFGVDIFSETERVLERRVEFVLLESTVKEIEVKGGLGAGKTKAHVFKIAKDLIQRCKVVKVPESLAAMPVDDQLLEYAISIKGVLATNDRELRMKARERGIPVLLLRGKKRVVLEGSVL